MTLASGKVKNTGGQASTASTESPDQIAIKGTIGKIYSHKRHGRLEVYLMIREHRKLLKQSTHDLIRESIGNRARLTILWGWRLKG